MATETIPDKQTNSPLARPPGGALKTRPKVNTGSRRLPWMMLAVGLLVVVAAAALFVPDMLKSEETDKKLTHTVSRGNLTVSVTEQGTLESSNNTEIKCKVRGFSMVTFVVPAGTYVTPGQELVRLDTKILEEQHSLTKTNTFIAEATLAETTANVEKAKISIDAYEKGGFRLQLQGLEKELAANKRNLRTARKMHERSEALFRQGYVTELEVDGNAFTVKQAELELRVKETEIRVLKDFTKEMQLTSLNGNLEASQSKLAADQAGLAMEKKRRVRAKEELDASVITAKKGGLVIYPSAASWKRTPDITEGATVRMDQVLLLMPDLTKMQVKVGVHESIVDRVKPGLRAMVTLPDRELEAKVTSVATITKPAGWWTGNVVKYDTIIDLPSDSGLKPGMSAEVKIILAEHVDILTVPVAAVVDTEKGSFCWVKAAEGPIKRILELGDSNDVFVEVKGGLKEDDEVVLNPTAFIEEAKQAALSTLEESPTSDKEAEDEKSEGGSE